MKRKGKGMPPRLLKSLRTQIATLKGQVATLHEQVRETEEEVRGAEDAGRVAVLRLAEDMTYLGQPIGVMAEKLTIHQSDLRRVATALAAAGMKFDGKDNVVTLIGRLIGERDALRQMLTPKPTEEDEGF